MDFLKRLPDESLDHFLTRFRSGVRNLSREEGELLTWMLKTKGTSYEEIVASFEAIYKFQRNNENPLVLCGGN